MMAYAELHMLSLLTSIIFIFSIDYRNADNARFVRELGLAMCFPIFKW